MNNEEIIQTSFSNVNTNNASSGLRENAILTSFGAKYAKVVGRYKGWTPEIGILTAGEEIVPNLGVGCGDVCWGREAPLWNILTNRRMCIFVLPCG